MSAVVNQQQASLGAQEPSTCCVQTKSSEVWQKLDLQPPNTPDQEPEAGTRPALEQVRCTVSPRNKPLTENKKIINSPWNGCNDDPLKGQSSSQSENSDLSDQEKDDIPMIKWECSVELDLRPDTFDGDVESTEIREGEQVYPEVLPVPLKDLTMLLTTSESLEIQHDLCVTDPCLLAMAARMINLEKLQIATIQKEQGKVARSPPATSLVRNSNLLKRVESPCSKANDSILDDVTKLTLSSSSPSKPAHRNRPLPNAGKVWIGFQQPLALPKKPRSGAVKLKKTETLVHDLVVHSNTSPKSNSPNSSKRCKSTKKAPPKPQKTSSEKTSVPVKASGRKT